MVELLFANPSTTNHLPAFRLSASSEGLGRAYSGPLTPSLGSERDLIETDFSIHRGLFDYTSDISTPVVPLVYIRVQTNPIPTAESSSQNLAPAFAEEYGKAEKQLVSLAGASPEDNAVELGAVESAVTVLKYLKLRQYAPPKLSWHGGDAVVMLWGLGDTTYAITVTEGEMGFVVRRNRRAIRMQDSISVDALKLADRTINER